MAGLLSSYSDATCNTHNALRDISGYACGVTFVYKDDSNPPAMGSPAPYAVPSLAECCAKVGVDAVLRIPGNTGCEMQFCVLPEPDDDVDTCMRFVYEGDLPDDVADGVAYVSSWCTVRMYDDASDEITEPVTASAAPPSWTETSESSSDDSPSVSAAQASATSTPESSAAVRFGQVWRICGVQGSIVVSLLFSALTAL